MRKASMLTAVVALLALVAGSLPAEAETPSKATVKVDAQHAALLNRPPIIVTDARHAVLVVRAGYRVRIAHPPRARNDRGAVPSSGSTALGDVMSISVVGTALLGVGVGVLVLGLRRSLEPRSG